MKPWQFALATATLLVGLVILNACNPRHIPPQPRMGGDDQPGYRKAGLSFCIRRRYTMGQ